MAPQRLHNITDRRILKQQLEESKEERRTLSFYRYFPVDDAMDYRNRLYLAWSSLGVYGRIYVATEGINAQISIPETNITKFEATLADFGLAGIRLNYAIEDHGKSFYKLKIKVRDKIVADGLQEGEIDLQKRGQGVDARTFNTLTDSPETIVIDMRNHYESEIGHFENAYCPDVETFRESLPKVAEEFSDKKEAPIVMYCTGGIRCEKAGAYLRSKGFENVYQLEGGIIEYARQASREGLRNKFQGKNFVFDERMGERIGPDVIARCHQCGKPADTHVNCANDACHILFIQCDACRQKYNQCCSPRCADFVALPEEKQRTLRKTMEFNGTKFGKGRYKAFRQGSDEEML